MPVMYETTVKRGNAVMPYRTIAREQFHSEFGARLFGYLSCTEDQYLYWTVKEAA